MNKTFTIAAICAIALGAPLNKDKDDQKKKEFVDWTTKMNKKFDSLEDFEKRYGIWKKLDDEIAQINAAADASGDPLALRVGHNQFSADTEEERAAILKDLSAIPRNEDDTERGNGRRLGYSDPNKAIDWVAAGKVNPIKNQGQCGSCYGFAANTTFESAIAIDFDRAPVHYSEQEIVDCSSGYGNYGCNGGWMSNVWEYQKNGARRASDYPYFSGSTGGPGACKASSYAPVAKVTYHTSLEGGDQILSYLQNYGPVAVTVQAGQTGFMSYKSGLLNSKNCPGTSLDHAITAVAYVPPQEVTQQVTADIYTAETICYPRKTEDYNAADGCAVDTYWVLPGDNSYCCRTTHTPQQTQIVVEEGETTTTPGYVIVANSWGTGWGDKGYVKFEIDTTGALGGCGVYQYAQAGWGTPL